MLLIFTTINVYIGNIERVKRKLMGIRTWVEAADRGDFLASSLLAICRTRPPKGQRFHSRFFRRIIPRLSVHPRDLYGFSVTIDPSSLDELVIYEECFVRRVYDLSLVPFTPDVVLDCGGFGGYFTLLARAQFPSAKFIAFEPNPSNYRQMCFNFDRNGISVDARCEAVSNRAEKMSFSGAGCGGRLVTHGVDPSAIQVQGANLCDLICDLSPCQLLLKLDVEGEERDLLPEILPLLPQTCGVFFESHHGDDEFKKLQSLFRTSGFVVSRGLTRDNRFIDAFAIRLVREKQLMRVV
jgi:FkbM family methyltransferase